MYQRWNWDVFLTERSDGSLSTGAHQYGEGIPTGRMRGTYRIRTGAALKKAIESLLASDAFMDVAWSWPSLLRKISRFSPALAEDVRQQRQMERDEQYKRTAAMRRTAALNRLVQDWVNRASWHPGNSSGGGGLGYAIGSSRLKAGVLAYAKAYRADHRRFPTGVHDIDQAIGNSEAAAQCEAQQDGIGRAVHAPGRVKLTVQFPEA